MIVQGLSPQSVKRPEMPQNVAVKGKFMAAQHQK
jgi:hypothetical protein